MSTLYHVSLTTHFEDGAGFGTDHPNADILIKHLMDTNTNMSPIVNLRELAGGNKVFCQDVFLACINGLDVESLISAFRNIKWQSPENVVLQIHLEPSGEFIHVYPVEAKSKKTDLKLFMVSNPSPLPGSIANMLVAHETADGARMFHPSQKPRVDFNPLTAEQWEELDSGEKDPWGDDGNLKPCVWPGHWHAVKVEPYPLPPMMEMKPGIWVVFQLNDKGNPAPPAKYL